LDYGPGTGSEVTVLTSVKQSTSKCATNDGLPGFGCVGRPLPASGVSISIAVPIGAARARPVGVVLGLRLFLPGLVSLRRFVGSATGLSLRSLRTAIDLFPGRGRLEPASPALLFLGPLENILAARPPVDVPFLHGADT